MQSAVLPPVSRPLKPVSAPETRHLEPSYVLQRTLVWTYLQRHLPHDRPARILELNCGTGDDSLYLTRLGHKVLALDPCEKNLQEAKDKADRLKYPERPKFHQLKLGAVHADRIEGTFDLIFSNFGGLNSMDPKSFERFTQRLPRLMGPESRVVAVIKSKHCLWEDALSLVNQKTKKRSKKKQEDSKHKTWLYTPEEIKTLFEENFELNSLQPIGFALPPAHLENQFSNRRKLVNKLKKWEKKLNQFPFLAKLSDHYLVDFQKK